MRFIEENIPGNAQLVFVKLMVLGANYLPT